MTLFAHAYLANGRNGMQAAISAGYSARTAATQASRLLKHSTVKAIVQAANQSSLKIQGVSDITEECILMEYATLAFMPIGPHLKASDKKGALDSVSRIKGLFNDSVEVNVFSYQDRLMRAKLRATALSVVSEAGGQAGNQEEVPRLALADRKKPPPK